MKGFVIYPSPVGDLKIEYEDGAVTSLRNAEPGIGSGEMNDLTRCVFKQLDEYFAGTRKIFDFPIRVDGTPFQKKVWKALCEIPYGETRTYKEIAEMIGQPTACRAVGMANNKNKLYIVIPCHRVIGSGGSLTGYGGGLPMKEALLKLEKAL